MSVGGICYPITARVHTALARYPNIGRLLSLPDSGRSELEIVRLLDNTHYEHVESLLGFIDRVVPIGEPICRKLVKQTDRFQLSQVTAELYLFAQLYNLRPGIVKVVVAYARRSGCTTCCVEGGEAVACSWFVPTPGAAPWTASPTA